MLQPQPAPALPFSFPMKSAVDPGAQFGVGRRTLCSWKFSVQLLSGLADLLPSPRFLGALLQFHPSILGPRCGLEWTPESSNANVRRGGELPGFVPTTGFSLILMGKEHCSLPPLPYISTLCCVSSPSWELVRHTGGAQHLLGPSLPQAGTI